ncbi:beta galactosidase jelly roll domain-containing protein [Streptomyces coelicoflavus]|uniref:beta galactosidase jelly roll domain-containing protein n=1 Tax=Streptomyces coelicoflavus TaxID=285562 RepID=UPI001EF358E1|nr:beta galactosidase jelly roll domain-containing protein [Streptomyces coelicoflavus]
MPPAAKVARTPPARVGPQNEFVVPSGFLRARGTNTIALAVTVEQSGVGPDSVELVNQGTVFGGVPAGQNTSPGYRDLVGDAGARGR